MRNNVLLPLSIAIICFMLFSIQTVKAQVVQYADPAVVDFDITDLSDVPADANALVVNKVYKLKLLFLNNNQTDFIPNNTVRLAIGLGTKMIPDPDYNLATSPFNEYFNFTTATVGSQTFIYAQVIQGLHPDFVATLSFNVKPTVLGSSTISNNTFVLVGVNPDSTLSDIDPTNNTASLSYTNTSILPVTLKDFTARNSNCNVELSWTSENEQNLSRYEVEVSTDGTNFIKMTSVAAANRSAYQTSFAITERLKVNTLMVRLKTIDIDGSYKYSSVVKVPGYCGTGAQTFFYAYPNPVAGSDYLTIATREGLFNGQYKVKVFDRSGRLCTEKTVELSNAGNFKLNLGDIRAAGTYLLDIRKADGTGQAGVVKFEKY